MENVSSIIKLTNDSFQKQNLQLTTDNKRIIFQSISLGSSEGSTNFTQQRIYSIDLTNGLIERWVDDFQGSVLDYTTKSEGGVYILGQLGINVQIYSQTSSKNISILHDALNGSYLLISSSSSVNSVAFSFSSFSKAEEGYFITDIKQLKSAEPITHENNQYDQIDLPQGQVYQWTKNEDNQTIEGILHYPPGKFQEKNLPVLVLIHGDRFVNEIRYHSLTRPGKDILSGIDHLIQDGIADRTKLTIGGYSYGGILTNWLITQTCFYR